MSVFVPMRIAAQDGHNRRYRPGSEYGPYWHTSTFFRYVPMLDYSPMCQPIYTPMLAPTAVRMTDENERKSSPHSIGIMLPIVDPI